eukprot:285850-Hanusia_phi.AAC.1
MVSSTRADGRTSLTPGAFRRVTEISEYPGRRAGPGRHAPRVSFKIQDQFEQKPKRVAGRGDGGGAGKEVEKE